MSGQDSLSLQQLQQQCNDLTALVHRLIPLHAGSSSALVASNQIPTPPKLSLNQAISRVETLYLSSEAFVHDVRDIEALQAIM
jgi:hypothetical protein